MIRSLALFSVLGLSVALLAGCSNKTLPPCPSVFILNDAHKLTQFRQGGGNDITDIDFIADFQGYKGECGYDSERGSEVTLSVDFSLARGSANKNRQANFEYFVAIPYFYPEPSAKAIFPVSVTFPEGVNRVRHTDRPVSLVIPVPPEDSISKYDVYIGFQETPEQLNYNRVNQAR